MRRAEAAGGAGGRGEWREVLGWFREGSSGWWGGGGGGGQGEGVFRVLLFFWGRS